MHVNAVKKIPSKLNAVAILMSANVQTVVFVVIAAKNQVAVAKLINQLPPVVCTGGLS